jgi:hypothetical protein
MNHPVYFFNYVTCNIVNQLMTTVLHIKPNSKSRLFVFSFVKPFSRVEFI